METEVKEGREKNISQVKSQKRKVDKLNESEEQNKREILERNWMFWPTLKKNKKKQDFVQGVSALLDIMQRSVTGEMKDTVKKV